MIVYEKFFYYFEVFGRNQRMCVKNNIAEKYFILGWSNYVLSFPR